MQLFPAIDLRGGKVVRLTQGDYGRMTVKDVCAYFGVSRNTLYRWIEKARLPTPVKMGRTSFFYRKSIHAAEQIMQQESEQFMLRAAKRRIRGPKAPASESLPSAA